MPHSVTLTSVHRTPDRTVGFALRKLGLVVIIAAAGGAAHLLDMIAANTILPIIGVPVKTAFPADLIAC